MYTTNIKFLTLSLTIDNALMLHQMVRKPVKNWISLAVEKETPAHKYEKVQLTYDFLAGRRRKAFLFQQLWK